jgi:hypothetical protein
MDWERKEWELKSKIYVKNGRNWIIYIKQMMYYLVSENLTKNGRTP